MPITRHPNDFNHTIEWTAAINEVPNQSSFIKNMGLFTEEYTDQEAILFDKIDAEVTLLPDANRREGRPSYGKDRKVSTYALPLAYFHHADRVTKQDYMSKRRAGTANDQDTAANVIYEKLVDLRRAVDQTHEYMMLQAIKGITVTPEGTVLANMFDEFGVTQPEIDFELGTATTNVDGKIAQLKDAVVRNLKTGGVIRGPLNVMVDRSFFDKLISHPNVQEVYMNSTSNVRYQEDLSTYYTWGISDVFVHRGVRFLVYGHVFNLPDGTTQEAIEEDTGYVIPDVAGGSVFRAYYGPSQRMDVDGGAEMFAWEYRDPKQRYHEMEVETAPLFIGTKPLAQVKVITSN